MYNQFETRHKAYQTISEYALSQLFNIKSLVNQIESMFDLKPIPSYLIDHNKQKFVFISDSFYKMVGIKVDKLKDRGLEFYYSLLHPDDLKTYLNFSINKILLFLKTATEQDLSKLKFTYNYRLRKSDGAYIHVSQEFILFKMYKLNQPLYQFGSVIDISHLKKDNSISFKIEEYSCHENVTETSTPLPKGLFTKREIEIIKFIQKGIESKEIAQALFISTETVKKHRKNILHKSKQKNFICLLEYLKEYGLP